MLAQPVPPLALTHAAPPIDVEAADAGQSRGLAYQAAQNSREPV
jgi:hypothetical protein